MTVRTLALAMAIWTNLWGASLWEGSLWGTSLSILTGGASVSWAAPVRAEPATSPVKAQNTTEEPAHRVLLLGATIYGAVSAPNAVYDVPWQEPFLLGKGAGELDRNFLKEIFKPVDRDEFLKQSSPSQGGPGTRATP